MNSLVDDKLTHIRYRGFFVILRYKYPSVVSSWFEINPLVTWNDLSMPWFDSTDIDSWYRPYEVELMIKDIRRTIDSFLDYDPLGELIPF